MATPKALNITYLDRYSRELAKKFCDVFFAPKSNPDGSKSYVTHISGNEIKKLTPIAQFNRFVAKDLLFRWKAQVDALKSPYFNYSEPEVVDALKNFMNLLSNKIWIQRHDFEPLLRSAICETLILIVAPSTFFHREVDRLITTRVSPVIPTMRLHETGKFYVINKPIIDQVIKDLDNTKTCDNYAGVLKRHFYATVKDNPGLLSRSSQLLTDINNLHPLNLKALFFGEDGEELGIKMSADSLTFEPEIRVLTYTDIAMVAEAGGSIPYADDTVVKNIVVAAPQIATSPPISEPKQPEIGTQSPKVEPQQAAPLVDKELTGQSVKIPVGSQMIFDLNPESESKIISQPAASEAAKIDEEADDDDLFSSPTTTVSKPITRTKEVSIAPEKEVAKPFTRSSTERVPSLQDRLNNSPIADLIKAIPPADKYKYIKVLFNNDAAAYEQALSLLNHAPDRQSALDILLNSYGVPLNWDFNTSSEAKGFLELIERRHSKRA